MVVMYNQLVHKNDCFLTKTGVHVNVFQFGQTVHSTLLHSLFVETQAKCLSSIFAILSVSI